MAFILPSLAMPSLQLPSRQRLAQALARATTIALWAVVLTYAAGRLARIGYEWARPRIAQVLLALAFALDGGLAYPDQPEPDPDPDSDPELMAFKARLQGATPLTRSMNPVTVFDRITGQRVDMTTAEPA